MSVGKKNISISQNLENFIDESMNGFWFWLGVVARWSVCDATTIEAQTSQCRCLPNQ
jgi:hypothetical protein